MACSDAGFACKVVFQGKSEEEVKAQITEHAIEVHGLTEEDFTPDLQRKLKSLIHRS